MQTTIPVGSPLAIKRYSGLLAVDVNRKSYWQRRFTKWSPEGNAIIQKLTDLETDSGDRIQFDLSVQLRQEPIMGDNVAQGNEENLRFFTDEVYIDQMRAPVSAGGRMTRKRTLHDLRAVAKARLSDYWSKYVDEVLFVYLSGARGINPDFTAGLGYTGFANNALAAPDASHIMYPGAVTAKNALTAAEVMSRAVIEKAEVRAQMMRANDAESANMMPVEIDGSLHYVCVMSPLQEHQMRTASSSEWVDFQKAAAAAEGKSNPLFKGNLGMIKNVVLHSHLNVIRFSDYGVGVNLPAARALFLGRQAGVIAFGSSGGMSFGWEEELTDYKNKVNIAAGTIMGAKKTRFNGRDFGVIAVDTYAAAV